MTTRGRKTGPSSSRTATRLGRKSASRDTQRPDLHRSCALALASFGVRTRRRGRDRARCCLPVPECLRYEGYVNGGYLLALAVPVPNGQLNAANLLRVVVTNRVQLELEAMVELGSVRVPVHGRALEAVGRIGGWVHYGDLDVRVDRVAAGTLEILAANDCKQKMGLRLDLSA